MENINLILDVLNSVENATLIKFDSGISDDVVISYKLNNILDLSKWLYFKNRIFDLFDKDCLVIDINIANDIFTFKFIENGINIFINALSKKYYLVCPQVDNFSVLVKPTAKCNLNCSYCYDMHCRDIYKEDMSLDKIEKLAYILSRYTSHVQFIWHGGEATLMGENFFREAHKILNKYPMLDVAASIMTNGTTLNEGLINTFKELGIRVGISFSYGFQEKYRTSTSEKVLDSIEKCKINGLGGGIIDVITPESSLQIVDAYNFYKQNNIDVSFNQLFDTDQASKNNLMNDYDNMKIGLENLYRTWLFDKDGIYERTCVDYTNLAYFNKNKLTCTHSDCRNNWLAVNADGSLSTCDRYIQDDRYYYGNIMEFNSMEDLLSTPGRIKFNSEIDKLKEDYCSKCKYVDYCSGGGCPSNNFAENKTHAKPSKIWCDRLEYMIELVYKYTSDVSILDDINPVFIDDMLNLDIYTLKDIKNYLSDVVSLDDLNSVQTRQLILDVNSSRFRSYLKDVNMELTISNRKNRFIKAFNNLGKDLLTIYKSNYKEM